MSWSVDLIGPDGKTCQVDRHSEGGTYAMGGTNYAAMDVTYNYGKIFQLAFGEGFAGFREFLNGRKAADVIPGLKGAVEKLGTNRWEDYWAPTPGNAGHALSILLGWAEQHPDAVFTVR